MRAVLALGAIGWAATLAAARDAGWAVPRPAARFGHGATAALTRPDGVPVTLVGSYHVSQQNTSTGRLTARCSTRRSAPRLAALGADSR